MVYSLERKNYIIKIWGYKKMNTRQLENKINGLYGNNISVSGEFIEEYIREYVEENGDINTVQYIISDTFNVVNSEDKETEISLEYIVNVDYIFNEEEELTDFNFDVVEVEKIY